MTPDPGGTSGVVKDGGIPSSYTVLVGLLAVLAFAAQFVIPYVLMIVMMPGILSSTAQGFQLADLQGATLWRGDLWFVQGRVGPYRSQSSPRRLCHVTLLGAEDPECPLGLDVNDPVLLGADDDLWVLSLDRVARFRDGRLTDVQVEGRLGGVASPFLLEGRPAVIQVRADSRSICILESGRWVERWSVPLDGESVPKGDFRAVAGPDGVHFFVRRSGTVFHRRVGVETTVSFDDGWEAVAEAPGEWTVAVNEFPVVFVGAKDSSGPLRGYRRGEDVWEPSFSVPMGAVSLGFAAFPSSTPGAFLVAFVSPFGTGSLVEVRGSSTVAKKKFGNSPFTTVMPRMMGTMLGGMFAVGVGFAIIVSAVMSRFRTAHHTAGERVREYAPLWRRAVAQVVDAAILFGPTAWGYFRMFSIFADMDAVSAPTDMLANMGFVFGGLFWAFLGLFWISALEGKWGITPGKWVIGIRTLGEDLQPCGFGRAILRNLLTFVDGFFNFLVGMILVALTERWQRVGDLVAKTVVVRSGSH